MIRYITILAILISTVCKAQVALPTFHAVQRPTISTPCGGTKYRLFPGGDGGKIVDGSIYNPGDTLMLNASSSWVYFAAYNLNGSYSCPIVIMSSSNDSVVTIRPPSGNGMQIYGTSRYVKITGRRTGDNDTTATATAADNYNFYITSTTNPLVSTTVGLAVSEFSRNIEIDRVKFSKVTYSVWAKNEVNCDTSMNYNGAWSFFMDSITIHHTYSKNIGQDVMYCGSTDQLGGRALVCSGDTVYYYPMALSNLSVHHNLIDSSNRTAIQMGGARRGINKIFSNTIQNIGYEYSQSQGFGVAIGGMTRNGYVFGNNIKKTFLYGVLDFGADSSFIFDNTIDSSGVLPWTDSRNLDSFATANGMSVRGTYLLNSNSKPANILASTKETIPSYTKTIFYNANLVGYNASEYDTLGTIHIADFSSFPQDWTENNKICSNVKIINGDPATIQRFTYLSNPWPVYSNDCSSFPEPAPMARMIVDPRYTQIKQIFPDQVTYLENNKK